MLESVCAAAKDRVQAEAFVNSDLEYAVRWDISRRGIAADHRLLMTSFNLVAKDERTQADSD